jgi:hypothetical protein
MPPDRRTAKLLIVDAGPLITLAAAAASITCFRPTAPSSSPMPCSSGPRDDASRLGAGSIVAWVNANLDHVHIAPTNAFAAFARDHEAGLTERELDLGERSAIDYARHHVHLDVDERAVLLSEDRKVTGLRTAREDSLRVIIITTRDFLLELERIGRLNSADAVYDAVVAAGRTPSRRELLDQHDPKLRDAVARLLGRNPPASEDGSQG